MRLERTFLAASPLGPDRQRLCGEVTYETGDLRSEVYWYDVPAEVVPQLSTSGNPWLAALLPLAMTLGEPLHIGRPVDWQLRRGVDDLIAIWSGWYPHLTRSHVSTTATGTTAAGSRGAAFFSGGIDSFFTLLQDDDQGPDHSGRIDDLVLVWGFDIPLVHDAAFARHRTRCAEVAVATGRPLIDVVTNLRETRWRAVDWGALGFGSALASVGLALEGRWGRLSIASAASYAHLTPWGSHPITDALHSTSGTRVSHEGAAWTRVDKTRRVAASDLALRHLHVCWLGRDDQNCSVCNKCCRTMATLDLLGAADRAVTFDWQRYSLDRLRTTVSEGRKVRQPMEEVLQFAATLGRADVAGAITDGLRRSARRERIRRLLGHTKPLNRAIARLTRERPLVWRIAHGLDALRVI